MKLFLLLLLFFGFGGAAEVRAQSSPGELPEVDSQFLLPIPAAQPSVAFVSRDRAYRYTTPVNVWAGRSALIDFRTGEVITFAQLSDLSHIVYNANAELDSGRATLLLLRVIDELDFEGQTSSSRPTLTVVTTDAEGTNRTYVFELTVNYTTPTRNQTNGVAIVPTDMAEDERIALMNRDGQLAIAPDDTLETELGSATIADVSRGLDVAITNGYTPESDPIVFDIRELIARVLNGEELEAAIAALDLNLATVVALAELGIEADIEADIEQEG
jgi:hypothetical protein